MQGTRRDFLTTSAVVAAAWTGARPRPAVAAAGARVHDLSVISASNGHYHGWPTLTRLADGDLVVVCSGGRESHVCPFGRVDLYCSHDGGATWSWPRTLLDSDTDDRDAGVLQTRRGTLLVTTFTSLAYEPGLAAAEKKGDWPAERLKAWQSARDRLSAEQRKAELGCWMIRSEDGGLSWSQRYRCLVNSPHGPIELNDGRLLYAGKELWTETGRIGSAISSDDGRSWKWQAQIPTRPGDNPAEYHELHAVHAASGRIIAHIRNHNGPNARETLQSESDDGGETWSVPHPIGVWGLPSHLLRLADGRLLMSYGYRRKPFGNQARISADDGQTWSEPMTLSADGAGGDLGYPSTVQLADGSLVTVWYERLAGQSHAVLRQARWELT